MINFVRLSANTCSTMVRKVGNKLLAQGSSDTIAWSARVSKA